MKRYFVNSELKISTVAVLVLMTLFLIITSLCLKVHHDNLKDDYIKSLGAISERMIEKNPEMEKEILPIITKEVSREEAIKGTAFLREYGLTKDLEDELFPYVSRAIVNNNYSIIFIFIIMATILLILNYVQYSFFYKRIRRLTVAAKKIDRKSVV